MPCNIKALWLVYTSHTKIDDLFISFHIINLSTYETENFIFALKAYNVIVVYPSNLYAIWKT